MAAGPKPGDRLAGIQRTHARNVDAPVERLPPLSVRLGEAADCLGDIVLQSGDDRLAVAVSRIDEARRAVDEVNAVFDAIETLVFQMMPLATISDVHPNMGAILDWIQRARARL